MKVGYLTLLLAFLFGCQVSKKLEYDQYLLTKNIIRNNNKEISNDELLKVVKQKPNRKILWFVRFHLTVYNMFNRGEETKVKEWWKTTIGEEPAIFDSLSMVTSSKQITKYLQAKGYFNAAVKDSVQHRKNVKKKRVWVHYIIKANEPYKIRNVKYVTDDEYIKNIILNDAINSVIKKESNYDVDAFSRERDRITTLLKNNGYFYFSREYIYFKIDSSLQSHQLDVTVDIKNISIKSPKNADSAVSEKHNQYYINKIEIQTSASLSVVDTVKYDTLQTGDYTFIFKNKLRYNPQAITQCLFVKKEQLFHINTTEQTYNKLSNTRAFKFINIQFNEPVYDSIKNNQDKHYLDCRIQLVPSKAQSYSIEALGTNSAGNLGIAGNLIYQHKNIFRNFEIFNFKIKGGMEFQNLNLAEKSELINQYLPFNTYEYGSEMSLSIPGFLLPVSSDKFSKSSYPKTLLSIGYNFQQRPHFWRSITNAVFGYEWKETEFKKHIINPAELNIVNIFKDDYFNKQISDTRDLLIINSYQNHLTTATNYSFIFNNQDINKERNFTYFRGNIEVAGNLLRGINNIGDKFSLNKFLETKEDSTGVYSIFGINYAQYIRTDVDYRYYNIINKTSLVFRLYSGVGVTYGNSSVMPFEKSFWLGGANSLRAWHMKGVGPGSYYDSLGTGYDKTADMALEGNLEYRFKIYRILEGAVFADAGNIWLLKKDSLRVGSDFEFNRFYKEIALGTGLGFRLNFSYFIIRFDGAIPLRDPKLPEYKRWIGKNLTTKYIIFNFAIGYPF
ncbi:MAG: BamA/TamA family outer membrane protein [Bacteroidales bacterium]|nr:BamA/TamA family outer membrane protein [Bacteroidales bacterium]